MQTIHDNPVAMPAQHLHSRKKNTAWGQRCVKSIQSMSNTTDEMGRTSRENKEENYDLVNSVFKTENFKHVLDPYGIKSEKYGGTPTKMQNYNAIRSRLETLRGEEMNAALDFFVYASGGDAVNSKKDKRKQVLKELMMAEIRTEFQLDEKITALEEQIQELQGAINNVADQTQMQQMQAQMQELMQQRNNMPDIQASMKKFNSEYVDPLEQTNNKILKFLKRHDKLAMKFNLGWFHALVAAEEVYYIGIKGGHPSVRPVNPLHLDYDKGTDTTFIQEGNWVKEEYWAPIGEIIGEYGDSLTDKQVKRISSGQAGHSFTQGGMHQSFAYSYDGGQQNRGRTQQPASHVYVMKCAWRSFAKVGILKYPDPKTGRLLHSEVDDTFKMSNQMALSGATIEWYWDSEIWEGTMIGDDIFTNIGPKENQTKDLPYVGYIYNNVNSVATSVVDLVKAHQYTYIIVWWRLEQELAKAKGKKFVMDAAQLPKSMGWDVDQWMYHFENLGVIWINSVEEGRKGDPTTQANFNQFQSIDMTLSQVVVQYMAVIDKLEALIEDIMGVSPQRMGDIGKSETATGAQTSISRSTNVTKPLFYFHDKVKEAVLNELLEVAKVAYIDDTELEVLDKFEVSTLKVYGDKLNGSQMNVFVSDSFDDRQKKDKMESLLMQAVTQGKASLLDVANVLDEDSMSYTKSKIAEGERVASEREEARANADREAATQQSQLAAKDRELDRAADKYKVDTEAQKDITIEKMKILSDANAGNEDLQVANSISQMSQRDDELEFERVKERNRAAEKKRELDIREKEAEAKIKQANAPKT